MVIASLATRETKVQSPMQATFLTTCLLLIFVNDFFFLKENVVIKNCN